MFSKPFKGNAQALHLHYRDTRHAADMDALYGRFLAPTTWPLISDRWWATELVAFAGYACASSLSSLNRSRTARDARSMAMTCM